MPRHTLVVGQHSHSLLQPYRRSLYGFRICPRLRTERQELLDLALCEFQSYQQSLWRMIRKSIDIDGPLASLDEKHIRSHIPGLNFDSQEEAQAVDAMCVFSQEEAFSL